MISFDFSVVTSYGFVFLRGLAITTLLTLVVIVLAGTLAIPLAVARLSDKRWVRWPADLLVEVVRATPLILQLIYIYYVLPAAGIRLEPISAAIIGLTLNYSAYMSEVYRGGIQAVSKGQREAAAALGLQPFLMLRKVIPAPSDPDCPAVTRQLSHRPIQGHGAGFGGNRAGAHVFRTDRRCQKLPILHRVHDHRDPVLRGWLPLRAVCPEAGALVAARMGLGEAGRSCPGCVQVRKVRRDRACSGQACRDRVRHPDPADPGWPDSPRRRARMAASTMPSR